MALYKQTPQLRKRGRVNQIGFHSDEKNSSDIFTVSAEGHWSNVGPMSWWEVIALRKRLASSPLLSWINCKNAAWSKQRSWHRSKDGRARSHRVERNQTLPACSPLLLSHCSVCFAFNVLVEPKGPLVITSAEESKHREAEFAAAPLKPPKPLNYTMWPLKISPDKNWKIFDRMSHSHADGMCGFAAIRIDGHSLVCN